MDDKERQTFLELQARMVDHTSKLKTVGCHQVRSTIFIGILREHLCALTRICLVFSDRFSSRWQSLPIMAGEQH